LSNTTETETGSEGRVRGSTRYEISFPDADRGADQDAESCLVSVDGERRRIRFHDYHEIYALPGLYEQLFYEELKCTSPPVLAELLTRSMRAAGVDPGTVDAIDIGAGNGMVGEELVKRGIGSVVAVDIIDEAAEAAERDRPDVYDEYHVADLTDLPADVGDALANRELNCLTTAAALGFGDIPPLAFAEACNLLVDGAWVAFTIKDSFLEDDGESAFATLVRRLEDSGRLDVVARKRYRHRLAVDRSELHYVAVIARKRGDVPLEWAGARRRFADG
jgi:predicted TPR repeat methyltransferase